MRILQKIGATIAVGMIIFLPLLVFAGSNTFIGGIVPCGTVASGNTSCTICHLFLGIQNIVSFLSLNIAFPLAAAVIMYGGILMLTSGGSKGQYEKGQKAIISAMKGLFYVFAAWLIVDTLLKVLVNGGLGGEVKIDGDNWGVWNKIPC